ncbi:morc family cw-type zinc finger protein 4 [Phtheirospermum japonicum]|uniref:Morc family cw-type zinc finger protein 4 n=1 Tax=Phtheirospermum japonicum TaxID=374723 RepID=A0A830C367_9LAMI|nr:morc family cw-type zinc finger protein 4 [Phtheirospermum japonicum]
MGSTNFNSNHVVKAIKLEQDFAGRHLQQNELTKFDLTSHEQTPIDDSSFCSTSSIRPAPICRQFWKAGIYDDRLSLKPTTQNGTGYLRIHPKFLHSNATSHKWAFGAMAELLDNSVDEVDYQFDADSGTWKALHNEQHLMNNLSILLQWSPFATEAELLKQCDDIGPHGTKIIIYNLWHNDEGKMELDFESDPEDICLRKSKDNDTAKVTSRMDVNEQHLANRLHKSLRAYLSILYLEAPVNFNIILRGRAVEYHKIANDLKYPEFIMYRPHNVDVELLTTIGFLKEAPAVNIHGFNVYHKNRLILRQRGCGDYHCGLLGYHQHKKAPPRPNMTTYTVSNSGQGNSIYKPVVLGKDSGASRYEVNASSNHTEARSRRSAPPIYQNSPGAGLKRRGHDRVVELDRVKRTGVIGSRNSNAVSSGNVQHAVDPAKQLNDEEAASIIQENQNLHARCEGFLKTNEELDRKISLLREEIRLAQREHARVLLESKILEKVKKENTQVTPV